ncbi:MAG: asparagine synthase (glutamine-hydrolyzing) [Burkholderiales bacterium]
MVRALLAAVRPLMCGIGGFFAQRPIAPELARAMQAALRSRGPDAEHATGWDARLAPAEGAWHNALIHARLSIIDPRPLADQPMVNERGTAWIVYNGEVYDWQPLARELERSGGAFRTRSDTEFILRGYEAWGIDKLLANLRGMFAFAIVDLARGRAYLARDRLGEKPLVYSLLDGELVFGSLVRAVLPYLPSAKRELSPEGIDAYLAHRYIPAPRTVYRHIQRLENGHYLEFDLRTRGLAKRRYWQPAPSVGSWLEALDESVRMRTIADRPLGLFLSSGVDSTVIASRLAAQRLTQFRSYTAAFPGSAMDEARPAAEVAALLGLPHTQVPIPPGEMERDFGRIVAALDEPFADPSSFPTWYLAREVAQEVKVVLAGDGGDELFAGYKRLGQHMRSRFRRHWRLPLTVRAALEERKLTAELAMDWRSAYSLRFSGFTPAQRAFLQGLAEPRRFTYWREPDQPSDDPLKALLAIDYANYLPEYILRKSDLCTMAHGLEARAPLLDHRFVERVLALAPAERFTRPAKRVLATALDPRLPAGFLERKKRGFNPPLRDWLRATLAPRYDGLGARLERSSAGQLKAQAVERFAARYLAGAEHAAEQILQLLILDESLAQLSRL